MDYKKYIDKQIQAEMKHFEKNKVVKTYKDIKRHDSNDILHKKVVNLGLDKSSCLLDLGCNSGYHAAIFKEMFYHVLGIDINEELIKLAHSLGRDYCIIKDMSEMDFAPELFDCVFAHETIEHSVSLANMLADLSHILRPGGYLVFSLPAEGHWFTPRLDCEEYDYKDTHIIKCTCKQLWDELEKYFDIIEFDIRDLDNVSRSQIWNGKDKIKFKRPHPHCVVRKKDVFILDRLQ